MTAPSPEAADPRQADAPTPRAPELPSQYRPDDVERHVHAAWEKARAFHVDPARTIDEGVAPYSIVIPPPNVTAALHLGHALNNTLQDVLIRWRRMQGLNTLWMPGTDHAGIATQTVVEKRVLAEEGKRRSDFERDEFVARIQAWKDQYERRITEQLKAMGASCDFDRQRFTMDPVCAAAVREAFFRLFDDQLIYRGKRLVNWDPATRTALADDEVEMQTIDGHFWYMNYPVVDDAGQPTGEHCTVATTRPETMLGDTAVAVNPTDPDRARFIGKHVRLPIVNRVIPVIGDDYVVKPDPESDDAKARFASGFLKVTPAHDPNDYAIGQRHGLAMINVMAPDGSISNDHGWDDWDDTGRDAFAEHLLGLDRYEAREAIVSWFRERELLAEVRPYSHAVGHSYRSHVPVEPYLSDQWYVKVTDDRLAGAALRAMAEDQRQPSDGCVWKNGDPFAPDEAGPPTDAGETTGLRFHPDRYAKTFQAWHENIRDWCISRQLWWGHRIPVWASPDGVAEPPQTFAGDRVSVRRFGDRLYACVRSDDDVDAVAALEAAGWTQDPDVLDTWFSSALWPISTMGWPDPQAFAETAGLLEAFNPSSVLCTAREIITLWVSRMVMFNLYFRRCLPFRDVFIHAMIQDGHGQKMSKSLGNGVDPFDIIHSHGADAMRFTLTQMATQTQDVRLPVDTVDPHTGRSFTPKFVTTPSGHHVAAPVQESPFKKGRKMVTAFGVASGQVQPTQDQPAARNTSEKFDLGRNFANKLWNATRFALGNLAESGPVDADAAAGSTSLADRWIRSRLARAAREADEALQRFRFNAYADTLYQFVWGDLCDWYLEAIKPIVREATPQGESTRAVLAEVLSATLRLLHPAMPFVTERLWTALREVTGRESTLCAVESWPSFGSDAIDLDAEAAFETLQQVTTALRQVRSQYQLAPKQSAPVTARAGADDAERFQPLIPWLAALTQLEPGEIGPDVARPADAAVAVVGETEWFVHGVVDADAERERLTKRAGELERSIQTLRGRLNNENYVRKAPAHLVEQTKQQLADAEREMETLRDQLG